MSKFKRVGKFVENAFRKARLYPRVYWRYGTLRPEKVRMPHCATPLYIAHGDERARKKILFDSIRGRYPVNRRFWNECVAACRPTLALDVGANYGECGLCAFYPDGAQAVLVEPNPSLSELLKRSLQGHPDADKIMLVNALAGDVDGETRDFYVSERWSGGSSAISGIGTSLPEVRRIRVKTVTMDTVAEEHSLDPGRLVFKIDVEGYEPYVLRGMQGMLAACTFAVGLVEVDLGFLQAAGWTLERYQEELLSEFRLYAIERGEPLVTRQLSSLAEYARRLHGRARHFDLLLVKGDPEGLPREWIGGAP